MSRSTPIAAVMGGVIGFLVFAGSLGLGLLDPRNIDWLLHGDWGTHFLGWHLFRYSPWTLPLGATPLLAYPVGSSVGLTDSIPVAAGLFKVLSPLLPQDFQYFGFWLLSCFVLQGVFSVLLMQVFTPRVPLQILGAALLVLSPPLLFRVVHPALTTHWLLLAALWLYLRKPFDALSPASFAGWALIAGLANATHPYLAMMVLVIMGSAYARQAILTPARTLRAAAQMIVLSGMCGLILWQCGYFMVGTASDLQGAGLGFHSFNLLSPIMPMRDPLFGYGPFAYATPGQYEGYAYLGAGMILLATVAMLRQTMAARRWRGIDWQHLPFVLVCALLTILALSPHVTLGARTIFEYSEDWWGPLTLFRSSGRMVWPVYYALVVGVLSTVARLEYRTALVLMVVAVGLQVADTGGDIRAAREHRALGFNNPLKSAFWTVAPPHYKRVTLVPPGLCATPVIDPRPFMLLAGHHQLGINVGVSARFDVEKVRQYCTELAYNLRHGVVSVEELYVLSPDAAAMFKAAAGTSLACTTEDRLRVCFSPQTYLAWQDTYDLVATSWPPVSDFVAFLRDLDTEYRSGLQRGPIQAPGTVEERARAIMRYLAYRVRGCDHGEAQTNAVRERQGGQELRICARMTMVAGEMPPPNETLDFRRHLESTSHDGAPSGQSPTHVDPEGEAVWLQEYARARLAGAAHGDARDGVLRRVRATR